jgi:hypothetical protein
LRNEELDELDARLTQAGRYLGTVGLSDEEADDSQNVLFRFEDLSKLGNAFLAKFAGNCPRALYFFEENK